MVTPKQQMAAAIRRQAFDLQLLLPLLDKQYPVLVAAIAELEKIAEEMEKPGHLTLT